MNVKSTIQLLQDDICEWANKTFGSNQRLLPVIHHLKQEVDELLTHPHNRMEFADCFILLLEAAQQAGLDTDDLIRDSYEKLEINKKRVWGEPDENGVVNHIEGLH